MSELFELSFDEEPCGSRPGRLAGVRPQERVQRHTVEQIVVSTLGLPMLDVPVPLMVEQLVEVLQFFDALLPVAEQVIDVPKITSEDIPSRTPLREPELKNSWWKCQQSFTSTSRPLTFQFLVVGVVFKVSPRTEFYSFWQWRSSIKVLAKDRVQQRRPQFSALQLMRPTLRMRRLMGFFVCPAPKKCEGPRRSRVRGAHSHSSSSELSAHQMAPFDDGTTWVDDNSDAWTLLNTAHGSCWKNLDTQHTQWHPPWERQLWRCLRICTSTAAVPVLTWWFGPVGAVDYGGCGSIKSGHYFHDPLAFGRGYSSLRNAWLDSGYMLCVSSWCFWTVCPCFLRK